ncbi:integrase catalytic domain-containing protein [Trichonephila clavipes]|nr:integrase catalytic domain-containing protein [Trichonephila clavipes]
MEKFEGVMNEKLRPLKPFLDQFGILRARTKLSFQEDTDNFKFPIILPNKYPVVHLMIMRKHKELVHAGVSIVMNHLRESFWILKAPKLIRQLIQKCTRCKRFSAQNTEVVPSSLPKDRVSNSKIFQVVGVDLAGPLHLKDKRKGWVVLFTCAVFRAVHFELITSLFTAAFLRSLRRFISRRGQQTIIYSDNGTNFVGSNSALNSIDWDVVMSKQENSKVGECCESKKERRGDRPESTQGVMGCLTRGAPSAASFSLLEWQQGEEKHSERGETDSSRGVSRKQTAMSVRDNI